MPSAFKTKFSFSKIFISVFCAVLFFAVLPMTTKAQVPEIVNVTGWAWSDNIGWIKFDTGKKSPVTYDRTSGKLSGYAWSDNIGWIYFGPDISGKISASSAPENPKQWAQANTSSGFIGGWARAYRAIPDKTDINAEDSQTLGGWDGWIKFDTGRSNPVKIDFTTGDFHGYAWGSDVVGWISFNCLEGSSGAGSVCGTSDYKVTIGPPNAHNLNVAINTPNCGTGTVVSSDPSPLDIDCPNNSCSALYNQNDKITLTATPTNGSTFSGWTGVAGCGAGTTCNITMPDTAVNAVATFSKSNCSAGYDLTVNIGGSGTGRIYNANNTDSISSTKTWTSYPDGAKIVLRATSDLGSRFGGWNNTKDMGNCTNSKGGSGTISDTDATNGTDNDTCTITLDGASKTTTVTFDENIIPEEKVNGTCGPVTTRSTPPTSDSELCSAGTPSPKPVTDNSGTTGRWSWACLGSNGGSNSGTCTANFDSGVANLSVIQNGSGAGSVKLQHMGSMEDSSNPDYPFDKDIPGTSPWGLNPGWIFKITATADSNSSFAGWSSNCDTSQGADTCLITMDTDKVVTVTFNCSVNCGGGGGGGNTLTVNVGSGTVTVVADDGSSTLICSNFATCSRSYSPSASVTLTATETGSENFTEWQGGGCSGSNSTCGPLIMSENRTVSAFFNCSCAGSSCNSCVSPPPPPPPPPLIDGACGKANKKNMKNAPQGSELCSEGGASAVSETSDGWDWTCSGLNGGGNASCHAGKLEVIIQEI